LNQNATQVFFFANNFHDHLNAAPIGFTEAAGNFQVVNSSGQGRGGGAVQAQTCDGANSAGGGFPGFGHTANANLSTPPAGIPPPMQMYLFPLPGDPTDPFLASNGGDESDVIYHEYTHGLSNRLVIQANGVTGLIGQQPGAMGEAWSDWYANDY